MGWGRPAPRRCELNLLGRPCRAMKNENEEDSCTGIIHERADTTARNPASTSQEERSRKSRDVHHEPFNAAPLTVSQLQFVHE